MTPRMATTGMPAVRPISAIAQEIFRVWKPVHPWALPYAEAMLQLTSIRDRYFEDDGKSIVLYFLANAKSWRGDDAHRIKAELKALSR